MSGALRRIAVVGGGISGLSAAFYARKLSRERGIAADITLFEESPQLGGKIQTLHRDDCVIERGPDSFLTRKLPILELTRELGIEDELVAINPQAKSFILRKGKLHRMPQGLVLGIPTQIMPFARTALISPIGKARAAMDLVLPRGTGGDEALGSFLQRRLGREVLEHIIEPLLAGIYAGDTQKLSLQATFPQFGKLEQQYGSLILGMLRNKQLQNRTASQAQHAQSPLPPALSQAVFLTYKRGLSTLIDALTDNLQNLQDCRIVRGVSVREIAQAEDAGILVHTSEGDASLFDAVIVAVPNYSAVTLLSGISGVDTSLIDIPYASVANVVLAYRSEDAASKMNGSGFLVPRDEGLTITACTWTSVKWLHTAPEHLALVRCYIGRQGDDRGVTLSEEELINRVRADLKTTMNVTAEPVFTETTRWRASMPQYPVGHLDRLRLFRKQLGQALPGSAVAGAGYLGVGIPDCIAQGKQAAQDIIAFLSRGHHDT